MKTRKFQKYTNRPRLKNAAGDEMGMNNIPARDWEIFGVTSARRILHHLSVSAIAWRQDWRLRNLEGSDIYQDCLQEIEIALLQEPVDFSVIGKAVHRCLREYGYYKTSGVRNKHGKESRFGVENGNEIEPSDQHCICGYGSVMPELCECGLAEQEVTLLQRIEQLRETHSVKSICNLLGVKPSRKIEKAFNKCFPQHAGDGRGGKRNIYRRKTQE